MKRAFRKISRVRSFLGATNWYLSDDCLLGATRVMYTVEYRRFYLRDLESIVVWPTGLWRLRLIIPGVVFAILAAVSWQWGSSTSGAAFVGIGLAWELVELLLGPTAGSRIRATGVSIDLPLVRRTRRAHKVLIAIDAAVRASRDMPTPPAVSVPSPQPSGISVPKIPEVASAAPSIADASPTNGI